MTCPTSEVSPGYPRTEKTLEVVVRINTRVFLFISTKFKFQTSSVNNISYYLSCYPSELLQDRPNGKMTPIGNKFQVASLFSPTMHRFATPATPPVVQLTSRTKVNVRMVSQMRSSIKAKVPLTFRQLLCVVQNMKKHLLKLIPAGAEQHSNRRRY